MNATLNQTLLARGLAIVGRAVATGGTHPALTHVRLDIKAGHLTLTATDLKTVIRYTLPVEAHAGEAAVLVPARLFSEFVGAVPTGTLTLTTDDTHPDRIALSGGATSATMRSGPLADFPALPDLAGDRLLTLPVAALRAAVPNVAFAAGSQSKNPVLQAVLLDVERDALTLVAADGFRLAYQRIPLAAGPAGDPPAPPVQLLVPPAALTDLAAILTGAPFSGPTPAVTTVTLTRGAKGNSLCFTAGPLLLLTRLVDGTYPKYRTMLPPSHSSSGMLAGAALRDAVRLAACFTADSHQLVSLRLLPATAEAAAGLTVDSESTERGANRSVLPATVAGAPVEIALHAGYVLQALGALTGQVTLELNGPQQPGVLRTTGSDTVLQLIMPMSKAA